VAASQHSMLSTTGCKLGQGLDHQLIAALSMAREGENMKAAKTNFAMMLRRQYIGLPAGRLLYHVGFLSVRGSWRTSA
jgi:hypothetical protein